MLHLKRLSEKQGNLILDLKEFKVLESDWTADNIYLGVSSDQIAEFAQHVSALLFRKLRLCLGRNMFDVIQFVNDQK